MRKIISLAVLSVLLLGFILILGCKEPEPVVVYVCENGQEVSQQHMCNNAVSKTDAENYAKRYVSAYFIPYGGKAQLISSYLDYATKSYFATFVVSEKGGEPYETVVSIDGVTGQVNCTNSCDYT